MMTQEEYARLMDGETIPVTTACPGCGQRGNVTITKKYKAKDIGTFSLAGQQMKFSVREILEMACGACGDTGEAVPR